MRQHFEAGQLHKFIDEWYVITSDPFILNIVKHCSLGIDEDNIGYLFSEDIQYVFNEEETLIMQQEITKLLEIKAIVETSREEQQILSPVFLRKNKTGDYRMVLNLEKLNRHVPYHHFKMENFELAIQLVNRGDFMASIDLNLFSTRTRILRPSVSRDIYEDAYNASSLYSARLYPGFMPVVSECRPYIMAPCITEISMLLQYEDVNYVQALVVDFSR